MRSPVLPPIRMNAAETSASSAIALCTPLTVVPRSRTTAEIDTFISDVSTTRTNIAIASRMASRPLNGAEAPPLPVMRTLKHMEAPRGDGGFQPVRPKNLCGRCRSHRAPFDAIVGGRRPGAPAEGDPVKYMLIMRATDAAKEAYAEMDFNDVITRMGEYNEQLMKAGVLLAGEGLADDVDATGFVVDF